LGKARREKKIRSGKFVATLGTEMDPFPVQNVVFSKRLSFRALSFLKCLRSRILNFLSFWAKLFKLFLQF
jgi:hypothetical protein